MSIRQKLNKIKAEMNPQPDKEYLQWRSNLRKIFFWIFGSYTAAMVAVAVLTMWALSHK